MIIQEIYEKYQHLDKLLSDRQWLGDSLKDEITYELWQAIKEQTEEEKND